jgi:hypothetical protein
MITQSTKYGLKWSLALILLGVTAMANSIEEPQYKVIKSMEEVEIRHYQPVIQAVTTLPGRSHSSTGFRRLAGFIFSGNDQEQKIAMTAPVQETLGETSTEMAFTMPGQYTLQDLPRPDDSRVELRNVPARTVAVVTFSGWATRSRVDHFEQELRAALGRDTIEITGEASLNQYNPPWTLPFLRRNEIMIEVAVSSPN